MKKINEAIKMISHGIDSISLYRKRDYYKHISSTNPEERWQNLGSRLRRAADKMVKNYQ